MERRESSASADQPAETDAAAAKTEEPVDANGAVGKLISQSFFPVTCMVPLEERIIAVREELPEFMKPKNNDSLLQETIRTFHVLVDEKDAEIGDLKDKLKQLGAFSTAGQLDIKFMDMETQSELDMTACEIIEKRMSRYHGEEESDTATDARIALLEKDLQVTLCGGGLLAVNFV